ncbi:hypothetical protein FDP41_000957 [Naegleria fowleri]|uniref:Smr domain-containing protein n=1 Tax=Naegleria fowleri TaxID=5763 RepID=A0A6A5BZP8_NAEFO|nr:uncharacterized protein FDP41_000957 [Naegleria fowleri]KAF0979804.1 hypothetical protein FDP41_000957 [Naegleria fowleri]CAG4719700.1 unnamed protein product [Naegleria fowleri]
MGNCFSGQRESSSSKNNSNSAASKPEVKTNDVKTTKETSVGEKKAEVSSTTNTTSAKSTTSSEPSKVSNTVLGDQASQKPSTNASSSNFDSATNSFLLKPASLARYLIGPKGATIKQLQEETSSKINIQDLDSDTKQVKIENTSQPENVYKRLMAELKKYGWEYDSSEKQFIEHETEAMKLFKELEKKISEESKLMSDCFERASKAHESGDGALAKQLSDEGKKHQELMKKYQLESAQTMFEHLNKDKGDLEIDLHGQYVDNAMNFLRKRIEKLRSEKQNKLTIIYGAGNHSDEKGPKIKPAVLEYLRNEGITFEEINHGSISANI